MSKETVFGSIPHCDGGSTPKSFIKGMFGIGADPRRIYDLLFTDRRIVRAKLSDGIMEAAGNPFKVLAAGINDLKRFKTGEHDSYVEQREKYNNMSIQQVIESDKWNVTINYSDINKISLLVTAGKKMVHVKFETSEKEHFYFFPAEFLDRAQQLIKMHLSDKFT